MEFLVLFPDGRSFGPADVPTLSKWAAEGRLLPDTMLEDLASRNRVAAGSVAGIFPQPTRVETPQAPNVGYNRYYVPAGAYAPTQTNGMAVAALVLGIISIFSFCFWPISCLCGLLAVTFGIIGKKDSSTGLAIAGIVCGILGVVFSVGLIALIVSGGERFWWR